MADARFDALRHRERARWRGRTHWPTAQQHWLELARSPSERLLHLMNDSVTRIAIEADRLDPGAAGALFLGAPASRWSVVYPATGAINTSEAPQEDRHLPVAHRRDCRSACPSGLAWRISVSVVDRREGRKKGVHLHLNDRITRHHLHGDSRTQPIALQVSLLQHVGWNTNGQGTWRARDQDRARTRRAPWLSFRPVCALLTRSEWPAKTLFKP